MNLFDDDHQQVRDRAVDKMGDDSSTMSTVTSNTWMAGPAPMSSKGDREHEEHQRQGHTGQLTQRGVHFMARSCA